MEKYTTILSDGKITIQRSEYIEDGWFIEIVEKEISLYEIQMYSGSEIKIGNYETVLDAINAGKELK